MAESRRIDALLLIVIIVAAAIIIVPYILPKPQPKVTLSILTRFGPSVTSEIESSFLASSYAEENNIVGIDWLSPGIDMWGLYARAGEADLILCDYSAITGLENSNALRPITSTSLSYVSETFAGVYMKHYVSGLPIWCCFAFRPTIFDLLVNESSLRSFGLAITENIDDLLSLSYWQDGQNTSLIGLDIPSTMSTGHQFEHMLTKKVGWELGIQDLTLLFANSRLFDASRSALMGLLNGEVAITLTTSDTRKLASLPPSISYVHLENMVGVQRNVIAVTNGTPQPTSAESFVDFLFSPNGQSIWFNIDAGLMPVRREAFQVSGIEIDSDTYEEFDWTFRAQGPGVSDIISDEDFALRYYLNSTACSTWNNLTLVWKNLGNALENGSISHAQFTQFCELLGDPLVITDPLSQLNESFTESYALRIQENSYTPGYLTEVIRLWRTAANQRYEAILSILSALV